MEDLPLNMLETPTTLLLTSGLPIQHVLASGKIVDLPSDITFICEISNIVFAKYLALTKYVAIDVIRVFGFFYMLRFTIQFFGHINPYDGGFIETIYTFTEPYTRLFLGFLPCIYGLDMGLIVGFFVLDRIETLVTKIVILDITGKLY